MGEPGFFQHLAGSDQTGCVETELGVLAAAGRPFARAFGMEAHPNSDQWLDAHFFCRTSSGKPRFRARASFTTSRMSMEPPFSFNGFASTLPEPLIAK